MGIILSLQMFRALIMKNVAVAKLSWTSRNPTNQVLISEFSSIDFIDFLILRLKSSTFQSSRFSFRKSHSHAHLYKKNDLYHELRHMNQVVTFWYAQRNIATAVTLSTAATKFVLFSPQMFGTISKCLTIIFS